MAESPSSVTLPCGYRCQSDERFGVAGKDRTVASSTSTGAGTADSPVCAVAGVGEDPATGAEVVVAVGAVAGASGDVAGASEDEAVASGLLVVSAMFRQLATDVFTKGDSSEGGSRRRRVGAFLFRTRELKNIARISGGTRWWRGRGWR